MAKRDSQCYQNTTCNHEKQMSFMWAFIRFIAACLVWSWFSELWRVGSEEFLGSLLAVMTTWWKLSDKFGWWISKWLSWSGPADLPRNSVRIGDCNKFVCAEIVSIWMRIDKQRGCHRQLITFVINHSIMKRLHRISQFAIHLKASVQMLTTNCSNNTRRRMNHWIFPWLF